MRIHGGLVTSNFKGDLANIAPANESNRGEVNITGNEWW